MLYDPQALKNKSYYLDSVLTSPDIIKHTVARHVPGPFFLIPLSRVWNPGGGSTLFCIRTTQKKYFLKIKHRSVCVESRLESESDFIRKPSLENEYNFLTFLNADWIPQVIFFDEEDSFQFLAVEWLKTFEEATSRLSTPQLLCAWEQIFDAVRILYKLGIVHTDIHEFNICFRGEKPVICDFEEARFLKQDVDFEDSLDVVGENKYGSVGEFPVIKGKGVKGLTCLQRLRLMFRHLVKEGLPNLLNECNFDNSCPYNLDEFQEHDHRVYQSLDFLGLDMEGHRPKRDSRLLLFGFLLFKLARLQNSIIHVDVGSNVGAFCLFAARFPFVELTIGFEALDKYVEASKALAFIYALSKAQFINAVCGRDNVFTNFKKVDLLTMFSVYHHIEDKEKFLLDLKNLKPTYIMAEFATQARYYPERGGVFEELEYIRSVTGYLKYEIVAWSTDYNRPIIIFSNGDNASFFDHVFSRIALSKFNYIGWLILDCLTIITNVIRKKRYGEEVQSVVWVTPFKIH